jgi:hypothetical protein
MSGDFIETLHVKVEIQSNGIIRLEDGRMIARLSQDCGITFEDIRSEGCDVTCLNKLKT